MNGNTILKIKREGKKRKKEWVKKGGGAHKNMGQYYIMVKETWSNQYIVNEGG